MRKTWLVMAIVGLACASTATSWTMAQPVPPPESGDESQPAAPATGDAADDSAGDNPLAGRQRQVGERFRELERLLLRMAELTAPTDPRRAALLRQAVAQSKQRDIDQQFVELVELLRQERLSPAIKNQDEVQRDLARLLELLLSEDRSKRIETEKERIREYLKRVNKIIKEQKGVQGETNRGGDTKKLADQQGDLSNKTGELARDLKQNESARPSGESDQDAEKGEPKDGEDKDGDKKDGDKKEGEPSDKKKGDGQDKDKQGEKDQEKGDKSKEGEPGDEGEKGEKSQGESKPGDKGEKSDKGSKGKPGQPQDQPPQPGQQGEGDQNSDEQPQDSPARERLEQAQRRMQEAQEKLEQAKREDASEKQAEALKELEQAKAELEEILRQLREEEMARMLAMLESRFRKMLDAQLEVYEGTKRLDQVPEAQRDRDDEIEAGRLSRKEAQIAAEAEKALTVLREEGSAVAFPEAVEEMRDDMLAVVDRLAKAKVDAMTQGIETDIIAALEEMIAALKKAQKDLEDKKQQQNQQGTADSEPPLVDVLAELKMIRALQMRVNTRTETYAKMTKTEQVDQPELLDALKKLAEREQRIHRVTRDIVVGRNR